MSRIFLRELEARQPGDHDRRWLYVPYDQLSDGIGPLSRERPAQLGIVLVECPWKAARRPYHKQKLALLLSNQRHFALEQAELGVAVRYVIAQPGQPYREVLRSVVDELGALRMMRPAERELRVDLAPLVADGSLDELPHDGWLTSRSQFERGAKKPPWRLDAFYRQVRRETGILMEGRRKPVGGKYSFDAENRQAWYGDPPAPAVPTFAVDAITEEVGAMITNHFAHHPGTLQLDAIPATREDVDALWAWAKASCMPHFGPFEDAMSTASRNLFHTRISPLINLHRLLPRQVVDDVLAMDDLGLSSKEGFIRQVLGWREFVHHVHEATDGFRTLPEGYDVEGGVPVGEAPGDAGYGDWTGVAWTPSRLSDAIGEKRADDEEPPPDEVRDGGARPSHLGADHPLPPAYWNGKSGMHCLDQSVQAVWEEGYSHHIKRLMVLANIATLLDVSPRALTDWFWVGYVDAYDWVVEPNVLAMGTFGAGDLMTTKPYVSGANYIDKMSDYCEHCAFRPRRTCPITPMYWAFLERHRDVLENLPRMRLPLRSLAKRSDEQKAKDAEIFAAVRAALDAGTVLKPGRLPKR
ncbi:MAG: cryptochrome/photolyase family protein [Acidobacteriota bacterium]